MGGGSDARAGCDADALACAAVVRALGEIDGAECAHVVGVLGPSGAMERARTLGLEPRAHGGWMAAATIASMRDRVARAASCDVADVVVAAWSPRLSAWSLGRDKRPVDLTPGTVIPHACASAGALRVVPPDHGDRSPPERCRIVLLGTHEHSESVHRFARVLDVLAVCGRRSVGVVRGSRDAVERAQTYARSASRGWAIERTTEPVHVCIAGASMCIGLGSHEHRHEALESQVARGIGCAVVRARLAIAGPELANANVLASETNHPTEIGRVALAAMEAADGAVRHARAPQDGAIVDRATLNAVRAMLRGTL